MSLRGIMYVLFGILAWGVLTAPQVTFLPAVIVGIIIYIIFKLLGGDKEWKTDTFILYLYLVYFVF